MQGISFKSLLQSWCSAQSVCLFLFVVYLLVLAVRTFQLGSSDIASWVQAFGAIVSIWAAWWIASQQSRRAEAENRRSDLAKCAAIFGLLEHVLRVVQCKPEANKGTISGIAVCAGLESALSMLDRIDVLVVPDPVIVNAVFSARRAVEKLDIKIKDYLSPNRDAIIFIYYEFGLSVECVSELDHQIQLCRNVIGNNY
jgi:hypothetical protein